jgi:hypothetical protein
MKITINAEIEDDGNFVFKSLPKMVIEERLSKIRIEISEGVYKASHPYPLEEQDKEVLGCIFEILERELSKMKEDLQKSQPDDGLPFMYAVDSSTIHSMGYEERKQCLYITFNAGYTYRYDQVPKSVWIQLVATKSKGSTYNAIVKGKFPSEQIK